jgi:WD40 repeat protein
VEAVSCTQLNGQPIAVTGSTDDTVRIWDLQTRRQLDRITLPSGAGALDVTATGDIIAAFGWDITTLERKCDEQR